MPRNRVYPKSVNPGIPRLPTCPTNWAIHRLGDVVDVVERPVTLVDDHEYTLILAKRGRGGIISRGKRLGGLIRTKTQFEVKAGDFLISRRQIVHGACGIVPLELDGAVVSNEYTVLRPRGGLAVAFLDLLTSTPYLQRTFYHASVGVHVEKMVFRDRAWLRYSIPVPPLREQHAITEAVALWRVAWQQAERLLLLARQRKLGLMQELLTGKLRFCQFKTDWVTRRLGEFAQLQPGVAKGQQELQDPVERPYLRVANVLDGRLDLRDVKSIRVSARDVARYELLAGDVLMNEGGAAGELGRGAVWYGQIPGCLHQNHVYAVRPDASIMLPEFLAAWTTSQLGRKYFARVAKVSTIATLDAKQLLAAPISTPEVLEQRAIVSLLSYLEREIELLEQLRHAFDRQRRGVADLLLTGKVRVPA